MLYFICVSALWFHSSNVAQLNVHQKDKVLYFHLKEATLEATNMAAGSHVISFKQSPDD